jgi:hypothetical protein
LTRDAKAGASQPYWEAWANRDWREFLDCCFSRVIQFFLPFLGRVADESASGAKLSQSLELAVIVALWLLTLAVQFATEVNTDVSIDQWSGRDWWNGGALLLAVFCTGAAYQHVNQLWHRRKSAPQAA